MYHILGFCQSEAIGLINFGPVGKKGYYFKSLSLKKKIDLWKYGYHDLFGIVSNDDNNIFQIQPILTSPLTLSPSFLQVRLNSHIAGPPFLSCPSYPTPTYTGYLPSNSSS